MNKILFIILLIISPFSLADVTTGGVNWIDPLQYQKPAFLPITVPAEASSPKYYVDMTSGSGTTCSQASPCQNISDVYGKPGTTGGPAYIYLKGSGRLVISGTLYGTAGNEIVIKPWPGDSNLVTMTSAGTTISNSNLIRGPNVRYLIIDGGPNLQFFFRGASAGDMNGTTIAASYITIARSRFTQGSGQTGPILGPATCGTSSGCPGNYSYIKLINNEIYTSTVGTGYGIYAGGATGCTANDTRYDHLYILNNIFRNIYGRGIQIEQRNSTVSPYTFIQGNAFHDVGKNTLGGTRYASAAIQPSDACGGSFSDMTITNNLIFDGAGGIHIQASIPNTVIYNNTIYDYGKFASGESMITNGISCYADGCPATVRNNIILRPNGGMAPFSRSSGWTTGTNECESGSSCGSSSVAGTYSNTFSSVDSNNVNFLKLLSSAPAINAGLNLYANGVTTDYGATERPGSGAFEIGAYEYTSGTTYTVTSTSVNTTGTGTITPASRTGISSGQTTTFDVSPTAGSTATMSSTCGTGSPASGTSNFTYTTAAITANCAVTATFSDVTPPVITNPIPTGVQASGTTQVTLGVTTELPATCKYGTSDIAYASLPNTFSSDGTPQTTHTQLTSVTGGSAYTFYVRCQDPAGNTNLTSSTINFSVASGDTTPPTISNITSTTADYSYKAGAVIDVRVTFSEAVTSTGPVTVTLETGATDRTCTFTITNATVGVCSPGYTVQAGDTSADLNVDTVSGTINDQASPPNPMVNLSIPSNLAANKNIVIDTTAPSNQNTVFAASQTVTASASVSIVSAGETGGAVWFAPSGTTTFVAGPTMTTASGTATTLQAPSTRGDYRLFVIDLAGNVSTQSTAILTVAWTVTPSVSGGNGTIAPSSPVLVANGATTQFTLSPSTGYTGSASGCGGSLVGLTYTTAAITANCTVIASFADTQNPTVSITAPTAGQVVTGTTVPITATASDNSGTVSNVRFKLDTVNIDPLDSTSPFGITWNSTTASEGAHTLTATATDPTGNQTTSAGISVTVDNGPPTLSALGPTGAQVKTTVNIPLVVTTNELAICRFAPSCATAFGSMTLFASDTLANTSHTHSLPVWAGASYRYCVKCQDVPGNISAGDYTYFSINAKPKRDVIH